MSQIFLVHTFGIGAGPTFVALQQLGVSSEASIVLATLVGLAAATIHAYTPIANSNGPLGISVDQLPGQGYWGFSRPEESEDN